MIFDAHFHILDPKYKIVANQGYLPTPFTVNDYFSRTKHLDIHGGAVVASSFQQFHQDYLIAAIKQLGKNFVGVIQLPATVTDEEILSLHDQGIRAVRFNIMRGDPNIKDYLVTLAMRVYDMVDWHSELYVDTKELAELSPLLLSLPKISIDHLGLSKAGFKHLLPLVEKGVKVKASGFMRVDFPVKDVLIKIHHANPDALMFGTDLPGTRASRQFADADLALIKNTFSTADAAKILWENAANFYGINV